MKNFLRIGISLLLLAGLSNSVTAQPQYYNYNTAGNGSNSFPFNISTGKQVQCLYLPGDFNQPSAAPAGNISSISFLISSGYPLGPWTYTDLTIKMAQSTITALPTGGNYTGTLTTVYYRASVSLAASGGSWLTITLDTPFPYNPAQSLIVDIGQCAVAGATGYSMCFTNVTGFRRNYSSGGCPFVYAGQSAYIYHTGINISTSGPPTVVTTAATAVTGTTATMNGTVNANGASTAVTFEYGLTTAYGTTVPGVPATVTGTTATPVLATLSALTPGTLYHYRVRGVNSYSGINGLDMTFTTPAILPDVVTTSASNILTTGATVNGTVNAGGASTAVTFEYGLTTAYGNSVPGVPATVTGTTNTPVSAVITGLTNFTTYHYRIKGVNSAGTSNGLDMTFYTTNCPSPASAGTITGPVAICGNASGYVYTVAPISGATSYTWTIPTGATVTGGGSTNSITLTAGTVSGSITVAGTNSCGNGNTSSLSVTVSGAPAPTITGPASMCVNSGYYNYSTQTGMSNYTWTCSSGGTVTAGGNTSQAQVSWTGSGPQTVNVNYANAAGCMAATPVQMAVNVTPPPSASAVITGPSTVCQGSEGNAYSVPVIPNALTYVWSLPTGATIANGSVSNSILVDFAPTAASGNITVYGNNLCGNGAVSPAFPVTVHTVPASAGTISGPAEVCAGETDVVYQIEVIDGATSYSWILPVGATVTSGSGTTAITVSFDYSASPGNISVSGSNDCGMGMASPDFAVAINPIPTVSISYSEDTVISSFPVGNQWYRSEVAGGTPEAIAGATAQKYLVTENGDYWTVVTTPCGTATSGHIYFLTFTGISDHPENASISIYPVPNDGSFMLSLTGRSNKEYTISVYNGLGSMIFEKKINGNTNEQINLKPVSPGMYMLVMSDGTNKVLKRLIIK